MTQAIVATQTLEAQGHKIVAVTVGNVELHCFCEKPKVEPVWRFNSTLWFHKS